MDVKDRRIEKLAAENKALKETIKALTETIKGLEEKIARLEKTSRNSSKPPSGDLVKPPRTNPRGRKKRTRGGQPGHAKYERTPFPPEQIDCTQRS